MKQQYRRQDFDIWAKRLRQLRPGMTERQVIQFLRPKELGPQLVHGGFFSDTIVLNDAYFADIDFEPRTRRMISGTPPLAITYDIKPDQKKLPKP